MDNSELEKLDGLVKIALTSVDIYLHNIKFEDIQNIRRYFTKDKGFIVNVQGEGVVDNRVSKDNMKYTALFQRAIGVA